MRSGLPLLLLCLFLIFPSPSQAYPVHAENLGPIYPRPEEELYLIKILAESFLADRIHYAVADNHGNLIALTTEVGRYTHKLECAPSEGCLIYDLWGAQKTIWDFKTGLPLQERKPLFGKDKNGEKTEGHQDWENFITNGKGGRIEALFLKDMLGQSFGIFPIDVGKHTQAQFFAMCILTVLMLGAAYAAARIWRKKHLLLQTASVIIYWSSFNFACFLIDRAFTIPPLHFGILMLASIFYFYRLHNRARRLSA